GLVRRRIFGLVAPQPGAHLLLERIRARVLDNEPAGGRRWRWRLRKLGIDHVREPRQLLRCHRGERGEPGLRSIVAERALVITLMPVDVIHGAAILCARIMRRSQAANGVETAARAMLSPEDRV